MPFAVPTLAIADNLDGTGATAVVTGSDSSSPTNTIQTMNGWLGTGGWTTQGTLTGNGTLNMTGLVPGYYWGSVLSSSGSGAAVSNLVRFAATSSLDAVVTRLRNYVKATIQALTLTGLSRPPGVYVKKLATLTTEQLPAIEIDMPGRRTVTTLVNSRDDYRYPVGINLVDKSPQEFLGHLPIYERWIQLIGRTFIHNRPSVWIPEAYDVPALQFANDIDPQKHKLGVYWTGLTVQFSTRELRGAGTGT